MVRKARESEAETSGATSGSKVAAYLRGDAEAPSQAEKILERLTQPAAAAGRKVATPKAEETVDLKKLEELAGPKGTAPVEDKSVEAAKAAGLEQANQKLSSLLGKPK